MLRRAPRESHQLPMFHRLRIVRRLRLAHQDHRIARRFRKPRQMHWWQLRRRRSQNLGAEGNVTGAQGDAANRAPAHVSAQRVETETGIPAAGQLWRHQYRIGEFPQVRPVEGHKAAQYLPGGKQALRGKGAPENLPNIVGQRIIAGQRFEGGLIRLGALEQGRQEQHQVRGLGVIEAGRIVFIRARTGQSCVNTDAVQVHVAGIAHPHARGCNAQMPHTAPGNLGENRGELAHHGLGLLGRKTLTVHVPGQRGA